MINNTGLIGPFFIIKEDIYGYVEYLNEVKSVNDFKDSSMSHFDYFFDLVDSWPDLELSYLDDYGFFPRGRVLYNEKLDEYWIYVDKCIFKNEKWKKLIIENYELSKCKIVWKLDDHYECHNCELKENKI